MKYFQEDSYTARDHLKLILLVMIPALLIGSGLLVLGREQENPVFYTIGHSTIISGGLWMFCHAYVHFLWKSYPWDTFPVMHIVLEVAGIALFTLAYGLTLYRIELLLNLGESIPSGELFPEALITFLITYLITAIHEMVYFYRQWILNFSKSVRLERDSIEAKYEILKTQINPHFLFNSLNSLTSIVDDNPKAVDYIQNLSGFLRYILGSSDKDLVFLRDELKVLGQYFELQKSRFLENLDVHIDVPEKYYLYTLPPLVLQMLVENCIKHNVISGEKPLQINIFVTKEDIVVSNNLQRKTEVESSGQGLTNIIERYGYFTKRKVSILETNKVYEVSVPLLIVEL